MPTIQIMPDMIPPHMPTIHISEALHRKLRILAAASRPRRTLREIAEEAIRIGLAEMARKRRPAEDQ